MKATEHTLMIFTAYEDPDDYPGKFVVRRSIVGPGVAVQDPEPLCVADTFDEIEDAVPEGLYWLDRDPRDPPAIMGVWL